MKKFTIFTVILTILVVVVTAETVVNKYLPSPSDADSNPSQKDQYNLPNELDLSKAIQSNVLGADDMTTSSVPDATSGNTSTGIDTTGSSLNGGVGSATTNNLGTVDLDFVGINTTGSAGTNNLQGSSAGSDTLDDVNKLLSLPSSADFDIEDFSNTYEHTDTAAYLSDTQVVNSGFVGAHVESQVFDGFLYKTINICDLSGITTTKYVISNGTTTYAKVYVLVSEKSENIGDVYNVLKTRAATGVEIVVNETNEFGIASFYMNDSRRNDVAFLTVRIGSYVYGFTYPKQYHPQIKNLISLLMLEGG